MNAPRPAAEDGRDGSAARARASAPLSRGLRLSLGAHAVFVIAAIIMSLVSARAPVKMAQSVRVDLVGLPDLKKSELTKAAPDSIDDLEKKLKDAGKSAKDSLKELRKQSVAETPIPEKPDTMAVKKTPVAKGRNDALKSAIDRIKALEEIESEVNKKQQKSVTRGNAPSKGNSLSGDSTNDVNEYAAHIAGKLRDNWNLPVWLSQQKLSAKIVIFLDRGGYVSNAVFAKSSGNKQFDDYCLKTIRMAQPFGAPPEDILDGGVALGFPL